MAMTLRLDDDDQTLLRSLAEREGLSQQEVVRRAIRELADRVQLSDDVAAAGSRAASRYSALLDRLSQ